MELKTNAVLIFKNNHKNSESHPDYKGEIDVNGQRFEIALWVKEGAKGKLFAGKISEPWKKESEPPAGMYERTGKLDKPAFKEDIEDDNPDDDLPF